MKKETADLTSFSDHLDAQYGKPGTASRDQYEEEFESFKLGVMIQELRKGQGLTQEQEIGDDALRRAVLTVTQFAFGVRQAKARQVDILTPGLADVALEGFFTRFAVSSGVLGDLT
jgi:hypothetical protein